MKRVPYILIVASALLLSLQCTRESDGEFGKYEPSDQPLVFSMQGAVPAASGMSATRGYVYNWNNIFGHIDEETGVFEQGYGIGIFAFHQPAKSNGYAVDYNHNMGEPEFMYNQLLEGRLDDDNNQYWTYSPTKYWPNNVNDQLSFFAYAPYDYRTAWDEDMDITCNLQGTKFKKSFPIWSFPEDQKDYLWTAPVLNVRRGNIHDSIRFNFRHICAQVGFKVGVRVDCASGDPTVWDDPNTDIVIKSIKIENIYSDYELSAIYNKNASPEFDETWSVDGSQTVNLDHWNMVEGGVISINDEANSFTDPEWNTDTWATEATYKRLNLPDSYLFPAPQAAADQNMKFTLTYELRTRNLKKDNEVSTITRTYTHRMSDLNLDGGAFEAGKAYTIVYLLGISGISVTAELSDWDDGNAREKVITI